MDSPPRPSKHEVQKVTRIQTIDMTSLNDLNGDCLRDVFGRLDLDDNTEVAVLNGRFHCLADEIRPKAMKMDARELQIAYTMDGPELGFQVVVLEKDKRVEKVFMEDSMSPHKECDTCEELMNISGPHYYTELDAAALHQAFVFAASAINHFSFEKVEVLINISNLAPFFRRFLPLTGPKLLLMNPKDYEDIEPHLDWILSCKPESIDIKTYGHLKLLDDLDFMEKYSTAVCNPSMKLSAGWYRTLSAPLQPAALEIFAKFTSIDATWAIIDSNRFMDLVKARSRTRLKGNWSMYTTRELDIATICDVLEPSMQSRALDEEYSGMFQHRFSIRDTSGRNIMWIDTHYKLVVHAVVPTNGWDPDGYSVDVHFHPDFTPF